MKYQSRSRENQDLFVLAILNGKQNGTYLEVGANHPMKGNNTYLLESQFGWRGVSLEWSKNYVTLFNETRKNPCIESDATVTDYTELLTSHNLGPHIDYLQLDIDPPRNTFKALQKIDFSMFSFSVITYEHDAYAGGKQERIQSREILKSYGYTLVVSNVQHKDWQFEDWYVKEDTLETENWRHFVGEGTKMNTPSMDPTTISTFSSFIDKY